MEKFVLKVRTKSGHLLVDHLKSSNTIHEFKEYISLHLGMAASKILIMNGFPPKALDVTDEGASLESAGIKSGDSLFIDESISTITTIEGNPQVAGRTRDKTESSSQNESRGHVLTDDCDGGVLLRQIVPADNSCLFTSIGFVLGGKVDTSCGTLMRQIIAREVGSNEEIYSEAILGKPNTEYCKWIQKPDSWGGAIELAVLSNFYGVEIAVVDTMNSVINRFGEDKNYESRVFLIFDGIHYDPLYREIIGAEPKLQTIFLRSNEKALQEAEELALEAKSSRQYTDVDKFTLRCLDCHIELQGQIQAQTHAQKTGHKNFGEIFS